MPSLSRACCFATVALAVGACGDSASDATETSDVLAGDTTFDAGGTSDAPPADTANPAPDVAVDTYTPPTPIGCGTAAYARPPGVVEVAFDSGVAAGNVPGQTWAITVNGTEYALADGPAWEAVRFDLDGPTRVWGFSVQWHQPPSDADAELEAGLYADWGHNGFDFWRGEALATGTRCAGEVTDDGWLDYVLTAPIDVDQPGLIYVAQRRASAASPAFAFDDVGVEDCDPFDACHSAINLPEAETSNYNDGLSLPLGRNFMVRLLIEPPAAPPTPRFSPIADLELGNRTSWGDYDGDGDDDLLTNGPTLYQNDGQGGFTDVTVAAGLDAATGGGGVWGDYDNDGCLDLFVFVESPASGDTLWRSGCDGTFSDVTAAAGIVDVQDYDGCGDPQVNTKNPSPGAAWVDIDADGWLDLYVSNFLCWSTYTYYTDTIFRGRADGTFEEWTATNGFSLYRTPSRGVSPADADGDGDVDLLVNNYVLAANLYFENQGDGTVAEKGHLSGLAGISTSVRLVPRFGHTIGSAWGDVDGDGDLDAVLANLAHPRFYTFSNKTQLMLNQGGGVFNDANGGMAWIHGTSPAGIRYQETHSVPALGDFDSDGALDLIITAVYVGRPTDFYWGNGDATFDLDLYTTGITTTNGWGVALADFDHDGDVDVATRELFVNTAADADGHWVSVKVVGDAGANREAIGATVKVEAGGRAQLRHVQGGTGQGNQDSRYLHLGLGDAATVDRVSVTFPGGKTVAFEGPWSADQRLWLYESGTVHTGWAPPAP